MAQRHVHDSVTRLPPGHADKRSPSYVAIELREAYADLDDATVDGLKKKLYTEVGEPMWRRIAGKDYILNHRTNQSDFDVALVWLMTDEAARRIVQDRDRRDSTEQHTRQHTCALCQRVDVTAYSGNVGAKHWCQPCRDVQHNLEVEAHAAYKVNGKTVAELIAASTKATT